MSESIFGRWRAMASAPADGTKILVTVRQGEQGPAEVDTVSWTRVGGADKAWVAADSHPGCVIVYHESELLGWMPLPSPPAPGIFGGAAPDVPAPAPDRVPEENAGSGI